MGKKQWAKEISEYLNKKIAQTSSLVKLRAPIKPTKVIKDKTKYDRKAKHKKGS